EYDRTLSEESSTRHQAAAPAAPQTPTSATAAPPPSPEAASQPGRPERTRQERASRDDFIHKASVRRFREALHLVGGAYDDSQLRGFDVACVPKSKLFAKAKGPRVLGRFVSCVDAEAVADAWSEAGKWSTPSSEEICIFLLGAAMAPAGELAKAI